MTALLYFGSFIDQYDRLASFDFHSQLEQSAVRINHHCLRVFAHIFAVRRLSLYDDGNLQHYTLAAAPVCWIGIRQFNLCKALKHYTLRDCRRFIGGNGEVRLRY